MKTLILVYKSTSNATSLAKEVNKWRLQHKDKWYQVCFENETSGKKQYLKCYNTWVQISEVGQISTTMDLKPGEFLKNIKEGIEFLISKY